MFDLKFGDPVLIRSQLKNFHTLHENTLGYRMDDDCEKNIIRWVKKYYKDKFGLEYKYVVLTHGAIGGLDVVLRSLKNSFDVSYINDLAFGWYEKVLRLNDIKFIKSIDLRKDKNEIASLYIVDSPSNPFGHQILNNDLNSNQVIWDSVYASECYVNGPVLHPEHKAMIGSFSKMFGLAGLRLGWVGLNDEFLFNKIKENTLTAYCGLSTPSLEVASDLVGTIDFDLFQKVAKLHLDFSRDLFNKLRNIFNMESPENGMFYTGALDGKNIKILEKAKVGGLVLNSIDGRNYIRFNMADECEKTKKAVRAILRADKL
jgi:histidinol-phosphate/aromatic aminotransferase/cobyric acid decarboxylase-like protein